MARKRRHHTVRRCRHHSVSGIGKGAIGKILPVIVGAVGAKFVAKMMEGKVNEKLLSGILIGGGIFIPKLIKGSFGEGLGMGMAATGGIGLLTSFGVLKGVGSLMDNDGYQMEFISGMDDVHAIQGEEDFGEMGSMDMAMAGYGGDLSSLAGIDDITGFDPCAPALQM